MKSEKQNSVSWGVPCWTNPLSWLVCLHVNLRWLLPIHGMHGTSDIMTTTDAQLQRNVAKKQFSKLVQTINFRSHTSFVCAVRCCERFSLSKGLNVAGGNNRCFMIVSVTPKWMERLHLATYLKRFHHFCSVIQWNSSIFHLHYMFLLGHLMRISFHPCSLHRMACTDPSIGDEGLGDCNGRRLTAVYYLNKGITHSRSTCYIFSSVVMVGNVQKMSSGSRQVCKEECQCIDVSFFLLCFCFWLMCCYVLVVFFCEFIELLDL